MGSTSRAAARPFSDTNASARTSTGAAMARVLRRDGVRGLADQLGFGRHRAPLVRRVLLGRGLDPAITRARFGDPEGHVASLFREQHHPREPVALIRPAVVARHHEVPQRDQHLQRDPNNRHHHRRGRNPLRCVQSRGKSALRIYPAIGRTLGCWGGLW